MHILRVKLGKLFKCVVYEMIIIVQASRVFLLLLPYRIIPAPHLLSQVITGFAGAPLNLASFI